MPLNLAIPSKPFALVFDFIFRLFRREVSNNLCYTFRRRAFLVGPKHGTLFFCLVVNINSLLATASPPLAQRRPEYPVFLCDFNSTNEAGKRM